MVVDVNQTEVDTRYEHLRRDAAAGGYYLNPDIDFTKALVKSLIVNERRYGYQACPCRLVTGAKEENIDIICPCDYRDADLNDYHTCYCGLYVSKEVADGAKGITSIPERRPPREKRVQKTVAPPQKVLPAAMGLPVWRCKVCGYLCAREEPPLICPICKVSKERFERFM